MIVTDFNGNLVDWQGTAEEALVKGLNVDCSGCSRCTRCSRCYGCSDCSGCSGCTRCTDCYDCYDCYGCSGCSGCTEPPIILKTSTWQICIRQNGTMQIGCQDHHIDEWMGFCHGRIARMHGYAPTFWAKWKPIIQSVISAENITCGN